MRGVDVLQGEWWRVLSCCFVHIGLLHLVMNMFMLFWIGPLLERMWGPWRFLLIYLISGVGGSFAVLGATPEVLVAGASGTIWGIMTSMAAWVVLNRARRRRKPCRSGCAA